MVKVLIYSSKEIYDNAPFEGRAEAHIIAYREDDVYTIVKNKTSQHLGKNVLFSRMKRVLELVEQDEWKRDLDQHKFKEIYKDHPYTTLMKNEPV